MGGGLSLTGKIGFDPGAYLKKHFRKLQAPLCGIVCPHSVAVAVLSRLHSDKISHKLGLAACENRFSDTL